MSIDGCSFEVVRCIVLLCFFFFKQKTAYEMLRSLVGSEMCIRDRPKAVLSELKKHPVDISVVSAMLDSGGSAGRLRRCLLYTSDAADDLLCVDLGGRRIIKKKTHKNIHLTNTTTQNSYINIKSY